jgi:hypothetical protein
MSMTTTVMKYKNDSVGGFLKISYKNEYCNGNNNEVNEVKEENKMNNFFILDIENVDDIYCLSIELHDVFNLKKFTNKYTIFDIANIHPLFQNNSEIFFDLIKNKNPTVTLTNSSVASIQYTLKIGERIYTILLELPELVESGKNRQITKLQLQNKYLITKIQKMKKVDMCILVFLACFFFILTIIYILLKHFDIHWNVDIL